MNFKSKWVLIAGTVLVSSAVAAGAAFAATGTPAGTAAGGTAPATAQSGHKGAADFLDQAVKSGKLTQAEADVLKQIGDLKKAEMEKLKTDSKAVIDQAVKDGKITQAQADQLSSKMGRAGSRGHGKRRGGFDKAQNLSPDQLKTKLDAAVKAGKLTQEKEDQILQKLQQRQSKSQTQSQTQPQTQPQPQSTTQG